MMPPMNAASRRQLAFPTSISRSTARLRSRSCARSSRRRSQKLLHQLHPLRVQYEMFSNANPFMAPVEGMAEEVRKNRRPVAADNPFLAIQENMSKQIVAALDGWRDFIEAAAERTFLTVYGSPALQAAVGIDPADTRPLRKAAEEPTLSGACAEADRRAEIANPARRAPRSRRFAPSSTSAWGEVRSMNVDLRPCVVFVIVMAICRFRNSKRSCASSTHAADRSGGRRLLLFLRCFRPMPRREAKPLT